MHQPDIRYLHLYPSQDSVRSGEPLNVMFAVKNMETAVCEAELRLWLSGTGGWRLASAAVRELAGRSITHVYVQIAAQAFLPDFWDGQQQEELLLYCGCAAPTGEPSKNCTALIFVKS